MKISLLALLALSLALVGCAGSKVKSDSLEGDYILATQSGPIPMSNPEIKPDGSVCGSAEGLKGKACVKSPMFLLIPKQ